MRVHECVRVCVDSCACVFWGGGYEKRISEYVVMIRAVQQKGGGRLEEEEERAH